jgi:hypothetical protein
MSEDNDVKIVKIFVRETQEGVTECAYMSGNGQLVIDRHASDEEHLRAPATRESQPLYDCRLYWRDVFPAPWLGRPGRFVVRQAVDRAGTVVEVSVAFEPAAEDA